MKLVSVVTYGHMDTGLCGSRSTMIHCCKCAHDTGLTNQLPLPLDCNRAIGPMEWQRLDPYCITTERSGPVCVADDINRTKLAALFAQTRPIVCRCRLEGTHPYKQWPQYSTDTLLIEHVIAARIAKHFSGRILQGHQSKWHCRELLSCSSVSEQKEELSYCCTSNFGVDQRKQTQYINIHISYLSITMILIRWDLSFLCQIELQLLKYSCIHGN